MPTGTRDRLMGQTVTLVFTKSAGIKNPSEASDAGDHSAAYRVLDANGDANGDGTSDVNSASSDRGRVNLPGSTTVAKIALNDDDNVRGYDLTVTGSGFNNGVTADVYVLSGNDGGVGHPGLRPDELRRGPDGRRHGHRRQRLLPHVCGHDRC